MTTELIAHEVTRRGYEPIWLRRDLFIVDIDGVTLGWNISRCTITSTIGYQLTMRKDYSRDLLHRAGLSVARGGSYRPGDYDRALLLAREVGWPVVVKPTTGGKGRGVSVAHDEQEFAAAWDAAASGPRVIVEHRATGDEARFLTVAGRCVAVAGRIPAHVVGDGRSTLVELVEVKNAVRGTNPHLRIGAHHYPWEGKPRDVANAIVGACLVRTAMH